MKAYEGDDIATPFLISVLDEGEWSAPLFGPLYPVDIVPDTYSVGGPVAPSRGCGGKKILVIR
jgi:hypothetical protein